MSILDQKMKELLAVHQGESPIDHVRRDTLERVRHFLSAPKLRVYRDLKGMCERVSDSYRDRVVTELLQNAHDAHPRATGDGRVQIALDPREGPFGTLYVANDGNGFTRENFEALCSPTLTTKNVNEAIGNKGVGFLSVFQVCAHPEVYSRTTADEGRFNGYCFSFAADEALSVFLQQQGLGEYVEQIIANMPRLYLACPAEGRPGAVEQLANDGFATVIRLPLKAPDALSAVQSQLSRLANETPPMQLFLTRLSELTVRVDLDQPPIVLSRKRELVHERDDLCISKVWCGVRGYVVAERRIPYDDVIGVIRRDVAAEKLPENWESWTGDAIVSLAVALNGSPLEGRLYNFLPMDMDAKAPFAGFLDAPFLASLDRLKVQRGVGFNDFLWEAARALALEAALIVRRCLPRDAAKHVAIDFALWSGERETMRTRILNGQLELLPVLPQSGVSAGWSTLEQAKLWCGDAFLTAPFVAQYAGFPLIDPSIGPERMLNLHGFVAGTSLLACSTTMQADVIEGVAKGLLSRKAKIERWDQFYLSIAEIFRSDGVALAGRRLLLDSRGDLKDTESINTERRGRRRRLRAMFLPPLRGVADERSPVTLPKAVQQRISFLNDDLDLAKRQANPARRFLLASNLVRDHESREILRLLSGAISDPGEARDPEALRWEALTAMMRITADEDTADGVVAEINPLVPTLEGWSRASTAYFCRWPETGGGELQHLFETAAGLSTEIDQHRTRLLRPYADWAVPANERSLWRTFLRKAGVSDILRLVPAISGPMPRGFPSALQPALLQKANLPAEQRGPWGELMPNPWTVTNPQTDYTTSNVYRLPGQLDFAALAPVVGLAYAQAVVRVLEAHPNCVDMTVYRPGHPHQPNTRNWASPVAAFLRSTAWIPLANGGQARLGQAWLPGEARTPPPLLPLMAIELRRTLAGCSKAAEILRRAGLAEFGTTPSAWRYLTAAGTLISSETTNGDAERLFSAAQEAWLVAGLEQTPPDGLRLLGRRAGRIVAVDPHDAASKILIADGDDRQLLAATARAEMTTVLIEPPASRAKAIASYLGQHFPASTQRASQIEARYESEGRAVVPDLTDPTIAEAFGDGVRQALALTLRYRSSFYRGNAEETLARLATVRVRSLPSLDLRVGDFAQPVPRFSQRAVVMAGTGSFTVLYSEALAASDQLLVGLALAIATAVGAPSAVGEPLLAFAAELGAQGLSATFDDYANILGVPADEIKNVLGAARASISGLLRTIRPIIGYYAGLEVAERFVVGGGMVNEEDVVTLLDKLGSQLPEQTRDLVRRCRDTSDIAAIAIALRMELAPLNEVISTLGPPYVAIDLTSRHEATLSAFLARKEGTIRESVRASFRQAFDAGESLAKYIAARDAARPVLPPGYGTEHTDLAGDKMQSWLDDWLSHHGASWHADPTSQRHQRDAVRDANLRALRALLPELRIAILARADKADPMYLRYLRLTEIEGAAITAALTEGWIDFDRLEEEQFVHWLARSNLWPIGWPSLSGLSITDEERTERAKVDEATRIAATTVKKQLAYSGGVFTFGVDGMGSLADHISSLVASNTALLSTSARTLKGVAPEFKTGTGGSGGGGGTIPRLSDDERNLIGFFGETIAFEWLKRRFGGKRAVDKACWRSEYKKHVFNEDGSDALGYDFEIKNGATTWYLEVKATTTPGPLAVQSLELGSSELKRAEMCKADRRERYRILYITNALHPEKAQIFPLPNPRSRQGLSFFADRQASQRLYFPLKG